MIEGGKRGVCPGGYAVRTHAILVAARAPIKFGSEWSGSGPARSGFQPADPGMNITTYNVYQLVSSP